jgi:hypothetical protein
MVFPLLPMFASIIIVQVSSSTFFGVKQKTDDS